MKTKLLSFIFFTFIFSSYSFSQKKYNFALTSGNLEFHKKQSKSKSIANKSKIASFVNESNTSKLNDANLWYIESALLTSDTKTNSKQSKTFNYINGASPTEPALGFNVFVENNATLITNESEGGVAIGGNLIIKGYYQVNIHDVGNYAVRGNKIGLLVGGNIDYNSSTNGEIKVNSNRYVKIGDGTGSKVWYQDQNGAYSNIRITEDNNYNSSAKIQIQDNALSFGVSASNNPVIESGLIDFTAAFQTMRASSVSISQNATNAILTKPDYPFDAVTTNLPSRVRIELQNGINYLNIDSTDLTNLNELTFINKPDANKILVINVNAPGTVNWNVWNHAGIGDAEGAFIFYNFHNTTELNIDGATIKGTVFAPFADINKIGWSNIDGQVIGKSLIHNGGEMHYQRFDQSISPVCDVVADNNTSTASITEDETKTLSGAPADGTWSIVSGGGTINGSTYTPADINTDTDVTIRYTIAADGDCAATTDDVTFTVTPV
ncbi:choice-of-anchor A family protein, partial [Polaribacter reichenbachii]